VVCSGLNFYPYLYKQIPINAKLRTEKERSSDRVDWEKSIKEGKVRVGL
jgi:hypothetical protein